MLCEHGKSAPLPEEEEEKEEKEEEEQHQILSLVLDTASVASGSSLGACVVRASLIDHISILAWPKTRLAWYEQ